MGQEYRGNEERYSLTTEIRDCVKELVFTRIKKILDGLQTDFQNVKEKKGATGVELWLKNGRVQQRVGSTGSEV